MSSVSIDEAQSHLAELIHGLQPGEELVITDNDAPVALLSIPPTARKSPRRPGSLRGTVVHMAKDFDAPLVDVEEHPA